MQIDPGLLVFLIVYGGFALLCFAVAIKKLKNYIKKKNKPKLILIQGGKKDGP